jgi:hypothetical protein
VWAYREGWGGCGDKARLSSEQQQMGVAGECYEGRV